MSGNLTNERYVRLTTWTSDGRPKHTPVWIVRLASGGSDGSQVRVGFTTGSKSWKVRRILRNPAVELQPSDTDGVLLPGSLPITASAHVVHGPAFRAVRRAIRRKYRLEDLRISLQAIPARLRGRGSLSDCAVVITLTDWHPTSRQS